MVSFREKLKTLARKPKLALVVPKPAPVSDDLFMQTKYSQGVAYFDYNDTEAMRCFQLAADKGHKIAQYYLGVGYSTGRGVVKNYAKAASWYILSARQGHAPAQHALGLCFLDGVGVEKNTEQARRHFQFAADQHDADSQVYLGLLLVDEDRASALRYFQLAAEQQHPEGHYMLGRLALTDPSAGPAVAFHYFDSAAKLGSAAAQYALGLFYLKGVHTAQDTDTAVELFKKSAAQLYNQALFQLGMCYKLGWGVENDVTQAQECLQQAAKLGCEDATCYLRTCKCPNK